MDADLRGLAQKWRDRAIAVGWLTHGGLARQECADELEAEASSLRGLLAGLREAITDWGDNMRSETMADIPSAKRRTSSRSGYWPAQYGRQFRGRQSFPWQHSCI